ncbi:MAG: hypothetical protein HS115_20145 [Spirochaetales bacterium]|nr:hypothetical protein [Spirochaetales bacterium]
MFAFSRRVIELAVALLVLSHCATYVKIPVVSSTPEGFQQTMRAGRNVVLVQTPYQERSVSGLPPDWSRSVIGAVEKAIVGYGYFRLVDPGSRRMRLEELARSQTGLTSRQKELGRELAVDGFLFVDIAGTPAYDCRQTIDYDTRSECLRRDSQGKCLESRDVRERIVTGEIHFSMPLRGRLINTETGQALAHQHDRATRTQNHRGNPACPAVLKSFEAALSDSSRGIIDRLSPRVTRYSVPLLKDTPKVENRDDIKKALVAGIEWADTNPPNLTEAQKHWEVALRISGYQSASAFWNMGVAYWATGNLDQAEESFRRAEQVGGNSFVSGSIRRVLALFRAEKERRDQEDD